MRYLMSQQDYILGRHWAIFNERDFLGGQVEEAINDFVNFSLDLSQCAPVACCCQLSGSLGQFGETGFDDLRKSRNR